MNGISFKIVFRWCEESVFKDSNDDNEGFVSLMMECIHYQWNDIITDWNQLCCLAQTIAMQGHSSGIGCFILYQETKKYLIWITVNFDLLTNPSWILVLEMINIIYLQYTGMRQLMNCVLATSKPCFVNSLQGNKSKGDIWRIGKCSSTTISIIVKITV